LCECTSVFMSSWIGCVSCVRGCLGRSRDILLRKRHTCVYYLCECVDGRVNAMSSCDQELIWYTTIMKHTATHLEKTYMCVLSVWVCWWVITLSMWVSHQLLITGVLQCVSLLQYVTSAPDHRCIAVCANYLCECVDESSTAHRIQWMRWAPVIRSWYDTLQYWNTLQYTCDKELMRHTATLKHSATNLWSGADMTYCNTETHYNTPVIRSWYDILQYWNTLQYTCDQELMRHTTTLKHSATHLWSGAS